MMSVVKKASVKSAYLHLYTGSDEFMVTEMARQCYKRLCGPQVDEFAHEVIQGSADRTEQAVSICQQTIQSIQTLPFFGNTKVLWLKSVNFFGESKAAITEDTIESVELLVSQLETLDETVQVVISAGVLDKRRGCIKKLLEIAEVQTYDKPDTTKDTWTYEVLANLKPKLKARQMNIHPKALEYLVNMVGDDTRQLENEIEKLDLYLYSQPSREVSLALVQQTVPQTRAGVIWEVGTAIGNRQAARALELISVLLSQNQQPIGILLAAIVPKVRNLLVLKDLMTRYKINASNYNLFVSSINQLPNQATAHLPKKKDGSGVNVYPLFLCVAEVNRFSYEELLRGYEACLETNIKLVTTALEPKYLMTRLISQLLSKPKQLIKHSYGN
jgi:DNA polymerase-3 subunit delta